MARVVVTGAIVAGSPLVLSGTANAAPDEVWDRLAQCESGGRWNISTGNGYSGGLQFAPSTWRAHGGTGSPAGASRAEQIAVAERVLASQGWGAWPACSRKVGAKGGPTPRPLPVQRPVASTQTARTEIKPLPLQVAAPAAPFAPLQAAAAMAPATAPDAPVVAPFLRPKAAQAALAAAPAPALAAVPAAAPVVPAAPAAPEVPAARPSMRYVVAPGDSLSKIAKLKQVPGGWQALHERNKDKVAQPSSLKVGEELTLDGN